MADIRPLPGAGESRRFLASERDSSGVLQHYRVTHSADHRPYLDRAKQLAQATDGARGGHRYVGSIPRITIDQCLNQMGKTWENYAQDSDVKKAVNLRIQLEHPHLFAKAHQVSQTFFPVNTGSKVLSEWRAENGGH